MPRRSSSSDSSNDSSSPRLQLWVSEDGSTEWEFHSATGEKYFSRFESDIASSMPDHNSTFTMGKGTKAGVSLQWRWSRGKPEASPRKGTAGTRES